jgi:hypothetical protein
MIPAWVGWLGRGRAAVAPACIALATALGACGSQAPSALDSADALSLQRAIAAARASADRGERAGTLAELGTLRGRIEHLAGAGKLPRADLAALRSGIARATAAAGRELRAPASVATVPPPTVPAATSSPPPSKRAKQAREHKRHGHGDHGKNAAGGEKED